MRDEDDDDDNNEHFKLHIHILPQRVMNSATGLSEKSSKTALEMVFLVLPFNGPVSVRSLDTFYTVDFQRR